MYSDKVWNNFNTKSLSKNLPKYYFAVRKILLLIFSYCKTFIKKGSLKKPPNSKFSS